MTERDSPKRHGSRSSLFVFTISFVLICVNPRPQAAWRRSAGHPLEQPMTDLPRVFVTLRLPEVGLEKLRPACDLEIWPERLPPPADVLRAKAADCVGLVTLLTD